jgi:proteasome lid subunit RPN8/RPN11
MTESQSASAAGTWNVPQCPFAIEYSLRVLDDIRLAVMDAFFSLPRGGAEIGGVLIGKFADGRVTISDYLALDCEHAFGPSFTLSPHDEAQLRELLDTARQSGAGVPVGWYHSHTRSEIFLSDADLAIHQRFFPEPWQVALVLKPHTFEPTRCGFFFRDAKGAIQAASTCEEFTLDPQPVRPIPSGGVPLPTDSVNPSRMDGDGRTITVTASHPEAAADADPAAMAREEEREAESVAIEPPRLLPPSERRSWLWLKVVLAIAVVAGIGVLGFQARQLWWHRVTALFTPSGSSTVAFAPVGLSTIDTDGQLQIHWDRYSSAVRQASGGTLSINDSGSYPRELKLDPVHLQAGNFSYVREGESVSVTLALDEPNGQQAHEISTFLGKLPHRPEPPADNPGVRKERDALAEEAARLRKELAVQVERNGKLQKSLDAARAQLREQIRKRLGNQSPDRGK